MIPAYNPTENVPVTEPAHFRPFSSGMESMNWLARNCDICRWSSGPEETPRCLGEMAIGLGAIGDGTISQQAADFIGTTSRTIENGKSFCELGRDCAMYEPHIDTDEVEISGGLEMKDLELKEAVAEAFERHSYRLIDLIRNL